MRCFMLVTALVVSMASAALAQSPQPTGIFNLTFVDKGPRGEITIEVPAVAGSVCATRACPLVIAMHGVTRNAFQTRDVWKNSAERYGLIVAAPYLDRARFPTRLYQQGGMTNETDRSKWVYNTIERLYDHLISEKRAEPGGYVLYGHSAGAQFVHRMVLAMPQARYRLAVIGNAGFYTLPTSKAEAGGFDFPYSLEGTPITETERKTALQRTMIVMLGDQDIDPEHFQLNNSAGAKAQGPHRFARGEFFFAASAAEAKRLGVPFGWRKIIVPGVAHENGKMANAAARTIFGPK